jgi:hypothetical protein
LLEMQVDGLEFRLSLRWATKRAIPHFPA